MEVDVRQNENISKITKLRFSDWGYITHLKQDNPYTIRFVDEERDNYIEIVFENIDCLIKALKKAKEIWE